MKRLLMFPTIAILAMFYSGSAYAAFTATGSINVNITVAPACTVSTTSINFGTISDIGPSMTVGGNGTITVRCSTGAPYTIAIDAGLHPDLSATYRNLTSGQPPFDQTNQFAYELDKSTTLGDQWGDGGTTFCPACAVVPTAKSGTGTGADEIHTVYGSLSTTGLNRAGGYSDTITVTVTY